MNEKFYVRLKGMFSARRKECFLRDAAIPAVGYKDLLIKTS